MAQINPHINFNGNAEEAFVKLRPTEIEDLDTLFQFQLDKEGGYLGAAQNLRKHLLMKKFWNSSYKQERIFLLEAGV
jgi:hypothetical protein